MTALILLLPYLAILIIAWDRRRTARGVVVCMALGIIELAIGLHLWVAFRV